MSLSCREQEIVCVVHWFSGWSPMQKRDFLRDLIDKAVPTQLDTLFDALKTLEVRDRPPSIFQCQLKLFTQWFEGWTEQERSEFMLRLRQTDPSFVSAFDEEVYKATTPSSEG